jgi:hypothetical protein
MGKKYLKITSLIVMVMLLLSISTTARAAGTSSYQKYETGRFLSQSNQVSFSYTFSGERLYVVAVELVDDNGKSMGTRSSISTSNSFTWPVQANTYYHMTIHFSSTSGSLNYSYK